MTLQERFKEPEKLRTCTRCQKVVMTFSEIEFSQGARVCKGCKKETQQADNLAFTGTLTQDINHQQTER